MQSYTQGHARHGAASPDDFLIANVHAEHPAHIGNINLIISQAHVLHNEIACTFSYCVVKRPLYLSLKPKWPEQGGRQDKSLLPNSWPSSRA